MGTSVTLIDTRRWITARAEGTVVELGIGGGLNLPFYRAGVHVIGIERRGRAAATARRRAARLGIDARVHTADALALPLADASADCVLATFVMCGVARVDDALAEALRVLKPGGSLLLADHVEAEGAGWRTLQRAAELVSVPLFGEHLTRRPADHLPADAVRIIERERVSPALERVHAVKLGRSGG